VLWTPPEASGAIWWDLQLVQTMVARLPFPQSALALAAVTFAHLNVAENVLDDLISDPAPQLQICLGCLAPQLFDTTQGSLQHREAVAEKPA
jgi:hypothetical protein